MTTTIKTNAPDPAYVGDELYADTESFGGDTVNLCIKHGRTGKRAGIFVATAELAAALGLVTQEDLDRKQAAWENECGNLEMAQRQIDAMSDAVALARDEADGWKARAEKAEATVKRVRDLTVDGDGEWIHRGDLLGALDPKPAFTLPTEVPARVEAKRDGKTYTFYLWTNGAGGSNDLIWVDEDDWTHSPSPRRLMANFTDHRVIGAES